MLRLVGRTGREHSVDELPAARDSFYDDLVRDGAHDGYAAPGFGIQVGPITISEGP